jgi:hypothetical protein
VVSPATQFPIQPLHSSFYDYLTDPSRSKGFYIDVSLHRNDLAFAMLQVMKAELHFNMCNLESSYQLNSDIPDLAQKIKQSISPALSYSCRYWASHVQQATATSFHSKIAALAREFLDQLVFVLDGSLESSEICPDCCSFCIFNHNNGHCVFFSLFFLILDVILTVSNIGL